MGLEMRRVLSDTRCWLALLCGACALAYLPGLGGSFLFDDFPNIVDNAALQAIQNGAAPDWLAVMVTTGAGMLRRPLSMFTFGLNVYAFGMSPFAFKLVNLLIHLLNGMLLYGVIKRIAARLLPQATVVRPETVALFAAGVWLLHPLHVSSVLYIVQRMNLLSSLFILAGLLCYAEGRLRMIRGETGLLLATSSICLFGLLAVFSKENGALIVGYALAIEWFCFRFEGTLRDRRMLNAFFWLTVALPIALFASYVATHPQFLVYSRNGFTLYTRLLSEARVLCDYLLWIFVPAPSFMGMYHDDIAVSSGIVAPATTALSIAFLAALSITAWRMRRRQPAVALGVAWFLVGHSLESTIFPLELVFEHRNYLPMAGPLLAAVCLFASRPAMRLPTRTLHVTSALVLAVLTATTSIRSNAWGSPLSLALADVSHHPLSSRSHYEAGRALAVAGAKAGNSAAIQPQAIEHFRRAADLDPRQVFPSIAILLLRGDTAPATPAEIADLAVRLRNVESNEQASPFLQFIVAGSEGKLGLSPSDMAILFNAALANPYWSPTVRAMMLNNYGAYQFNILHDQQEAIRLTIAASAAEPTNPYFPLNLAQIAVAVGDREKAAEYLGKAKELDKAHIHDQAIEQVGRQIEVMARSGNEPAKS